MSLQVVMKVCADPINRQILELLRNSSLSAGQISEHFDVSFGAVSQHLAALKEADLVRNHRKGRYIIYELNTSVLEQVLLWVQSLCIRDEAITKQASSLQMEEDH